MLRGGVFSRRSAQSICQRWQVDVQKRQVGTSDKAWGRMARKVSVNDLPPPKKGPDQGVPKLQKNHVTSVDQEPTASAYMDAMRTITNPESHVKSIEEELQETVAAALGKSSTKVANAIRECEVMRAEILEGEATEEKLEAYETLRKKAFHFRWELTIHRQACGFVSGNHKLIEDLYKIPEKIGDDASPVKKKDKPKFGVQTSFWESRRWRN
ncbi:hypothetical protein TrCOL_g6556 [Triparma columacea]|uniref:Uncharacterized protein n=1 Tax=Triparma columacea TaxID=722753 RepID=A0A9W7GFK8_9STRA|nr:hypothetical protein TrCOL_g6556 [Triparma columacea]